MNLCVNTYSYMSMVNGSFTLFDAVKEAAKTGIKHIEFTMFEHCENVFDLAKRIRECCDDNNLKVTNYAVRADFINCRGNDIKKELLHLKECLEVTKILGADKMRHDTSYGFPASKSGGKSFDDALPILVESCREVTKMGKEMGITTMTENHGQFSQDSERVEKLVCAVNDDNFKVLLDIGNFLCADESPEKAVGRLLPYVGHVHIKDFFYRSGNGQNPGRGFFGTRAGNYIRGTVVGHGDVPVFQCLKLIKKSGYDKELSLEFEGMENPITAINTGLENIQKYWDLA